MAGRVKNNPAPQDFTLGLALADALPVLFFGAAMVLAARNFGSILFGVGAAVITLAGCGKVLWKLLLSTRKKNVAWLNRYFIPCQIGGFLLVVLGAVLHFPGWQAAAKLTQLPAGAFFALWLLGLCLMGWYRKKRFDNSLRANRTAQCINTLAQGCLLAGMLLL